MHDLVILNGKIFYERKFKLGHIGVTNSKIAEISFDKVLEGKETIDAQNEWVIPGVIDSQVHFRDPGMGHKEDLESGSMAAALGGVTTFLEMPNTNPATTTVEALKEKLEIASKKSYVNYGFFVGATGDNLEELQKAQDLPGCCGTKIFLGSSTGTLLLDDYDKILEVLEGVEGVISCHSENEKVLKERISIRNQATSAHEHPNWRNVESAFSSTQKLIGLAKKAKRKVHVLHVTTKEEIEFLAENKDACTIEVTPQHLTLFSPDCYDRLGTYAQMNPPIREKYHQEALWKAVKSGAVDVIGSDHAPHTKEEKDQGYPKSPSGMPGVQTIFEVMLYHVSQNKLSLERAIELLTENPAKLFQLKSKGKIEVGFDADFTVFNLKQSHLIENKDQASRCGWTPYHQLEVPSSVTATIVGGELVMRKGELLKKSGKPV